MKRILVVSIMAFILAMTGIAWGASGTTQDTHHNPVHKSTPPPTCTAKVFKPFSAAVWRHGKFMQGNPASKAAIAAQRRRIHCAGPGNRKVMQNVWHEDQESFYRHRNTMLPPEFYGCTSIGGCKRWPIPPPNVECESGGDYTPNVGPAPSGGAFGLIESTWVAQGGTAFAEYASAATPKGQTIVAHRVWMTSGEGAWGPFEGGCG